MPGTAVRGVGEGHSQRQPDIAEAYDSYFYPALFVGIEQATIRLTVLR